MAKRKKKHKRSPGRGIGVLVILLLFLMAAVLILEQLKTRVPEVFYRPEDFVWEDGRLTCVSAETSPGIDVSYYQGQIDWEQVKASGIEFAFVRVGYRSSANGSVCADEMAQRNLAGAAAAGLKVGAYFFSQALNPQEAVEEAAFAVSMVKDYHLDLPIAYDWEFVDEDARTEGMTKDALMECVDAFCATVEAAGYESMVYFNRDLSRRMLDVDRLGDRPIWFAMYDTHPDAPRKPDYWQYTDEGTVPGIEGYVDLNLYFVE